MTTIEKLNEKYFMYTGRSPKLSFWAWLDALGIEPNEDQLKMLLNKSEKCFAESCK